MISRYILLAGLCIVLTACGKVNQENYAKLKAGMSKSEVETLLGQPTECSGALGVASCSWEDGEASISVQYAGDKVMIFSGRGLK